MARTTNQAAGSSKTLAIGYVRVSTDDQRTGPKAQRDALQRWADANDAELVEVFEDHGISGAAHLDDRPGLMAAIDALTRGAVLVAAKRDRIARDTMAAAMIERMVERAGARIVSADGIGNGDSPEAVLMRRMVDAFAEYERAIIRARTKAALRAKKVRRERTGNVPYGFMLAADRVHLVEHPAEQAVLAEARELRAAGLSLRKVATELARRGFVSRTSRTFNATQIKRMMEAA